MLEPPLRDRGQARIHGRHDAFGAVDERDRRLVAHVDAGIDAAQRVIHEVAHRGRELDPHRAGADDREREQLPPPRGVGDQRGVLEGREDAMAHRAAVLEPLHDQRVLFDAGDAEVVGHATRRDDDMVVGDLAVFGPHHLFLDVDRQDLGPEETEAGFREWHA